VRTGAQPALILADAGWHLSYLSMDEDAVRAKIRAFAHQEYNSAEFLGAIDIPALLASGKDLYDRPGYVWRLVGRDERAAVAGGPAGMAHLFAATRWPMSPSSRPFGFWERHRTAIFFRPARPSSARADIGQAEHLLAAGD
jgi:hypothetical protein